MDKFVDLIFDFNMKDLEDETKLLENYKKLQQENQQLKEELKYTVPIVEHNKIVSKQLKEKQKYKEVIDKTIEYIEKEYDDYEEFIYGKAFKNKLLDILKEVG